jgi:hypothetical protein
MYASISLAALLALPVARALVQPDNTVLNIPSIKQFELTSSG